MLQFVPLRPPHHHAIMHYSRGHTCDMHMACTLIERTTKGMCGRLQHVTVLTAKATIGLP